MTTQQTIKVMQLSDRIIKIIEDKDNFTQKVFNTIRRIAGLVFAGMILGAFFTR